MPPDPAYLRERHGLHQGDDADVTEDGGILRIVRAEASRTSRPSYSPRGIGTLWERHASPDGSALGEVLGRTRAILLSQLDLPMSTT